MKILFVIPRNKSLFGDEVNITGIPHMGIAYLSSFIKQHGYDAAVYDDGIEHSIPGLLEKIRVFNPDIIGITVFSYSYGSARNLINAIKDSFDVPIVAGGAHVSAVGIKVLEKNRIDFAIKNEGELTLLELLDEIRNNTRQFDRIPGLIWRNAGQIVENKDRQYIRQLDSLPFPDYDIFNIKNYACYKHKTLPMITSRGCPFRCNYCSVRLSMGQIFRPRSAENVFSELKHFYERGFRSFDINDDCFTLDKQRVIRICDLIIENKLDIRFQLYNGIRVDTVDLYLLKKLKQCGCFFISFGCETGNQKVLDTIKKGITLEQVKNAVKWSNAAGIHNSVNFIIGHKEETYKDALETIDFAKSLPTDFVNFYNLLPYPGTESYQWVTENARLLVSPDSFLENISYRDNAPVYETGEFSAAERKEIISSGFELYRKRILTFRLGRFLGNLIFLVTKFSLINKLASRFALNNALGRHIYTRLARKSFMAKDNITRDISK